jgi:integrase
MGHDLPAFVSWYTDRHGKRRYRFRKPGLPSRDIPGEPHSEQFQLALAQAQSGVGKRGRRAAGFGPRTLAAAWANVRTSAEWKQLKPSSRAQQTAVAERFLGMPIAPSERQTFGQMPFAGITRGHVKKILARFEHPHAAEAVLRLLRKMSLVALDLDWIENDPTHRVKFRPKLIGHRAWTDAELAAYELKWPIGTRQRLGFALALYTGQRRADVAAMQWSAYDGTGIAVVQEKTGAPLWIPAHPELKAILDVTERHGPAILSGVHRSRYTRESFGNFMADAIEAAGLPADCRLHGLRKSAGRCLAETGATTRMIMALLGHKSLKEAEHYTREVEQRRLAAAGMDQWARPKLARVK